MSALRPMAMVGGASMRFAGSGLPTILAGAGTPLAAFAIGQDGVFKAIRFGSGSSS